MVKNEADVIEPFVRHNLQFVDALFVLENGSVDATRTILLELQREGLPVAILDDPEAGYAQGDKMTRLLRSLTSTVFPDYVVPLDADEFIRCDSRAAFDRALATIPPGGVGTVEWVTYVLTPTDLEAGVDDPPRDMPHRRTVEEPTYRKSILRADRAYLPHFEFAQGNHEVTRVDGRPVEHIPLTEVTLGHFPVRSAKQLEAKAVVGWMGYLLKDADARSRRLGYQWQQAFDAVAAGNGLDASQVAESSLLYAQTSRDIDWARDVVADPMPFTYTRRYDPGAGDSTVSVVARSWEATITTPWSFATEIDTRIEQTRDRVGTAEGTARPLTAFDNDWHLERPYVDVPPMRFLAEKYRPASVLDVGCGLGAYLMVFEEFADSDVFGLEGFDAETLLLEPEQFGFADITKGFDLGRQFDLVMCVEVIEHIEAHDESTVLDSITRHARDFILFSAGDEDQPGHGHINCRRIDHWLSAWAARGWEPVEFDTLAFRSLATFSWLRRNPVLLKRSHGDATGGAGQDVLPQIGAKTYRWFSQDPEIIDYPLSQDPPEDVYDPGFGAGLPRPATSST